MPQFAFEPQTPAVVKDDVSLRERRDKRRDNKSKHRDNPKRNVQEQGQPKKHKGPHRAQPPRLNDFLSWCDSPDAPKFEGKSLSSAIFRGVKYKDSCRICVGDHATMSCPNEGLEARIYKAIKSHPEAGRKAPALVQAHKALQSFKSQRS